MSLGITRYIETTCPSIKIQEHIKLILSSENEETKVFYRHYQNDKKYFFIIKLANSLESFSHLHFFSMDHIDYKYDEYEYIEMSENDFNVWVKLSANLISLQD